MLNRRGLFGFFAGAAVAAPAVVMAASRGYAVGGVLESTRSFLAGESCGEGIVPATVDLGRTIVRWSVAINPNGTIVGMVKEGEALETVLSFDSDHFDRNGHLIADCTISRDPDDYWQGCA